MDTKDIGNLGEHMALVELLKYGVIVSRPLGDNARYDLILDLFGILNTCQVKSTTTGTKEVVRFDLCSSYVHRGRGTAGYDVDCFILVDIENNNCFLLFKKDLEINNTYINLRYEPTKNNQVKGIRWANDYLLKNVLND